jgi:hypothetical protein
MSGYDIVLESSLTPHGELYVATATSGNWSIILGIHTVCCNMKPIWVDNSAITPKSGKHSVRLKHFWQCVSCGGRLKCSAPMNTDWMFGIRNETKDTEVISWLSKWLDIPEECLDVKVVWS